MLRSPLEEVLTLAMRERKVFLDLFVFSARWDPLAASATTPMPTSTETGHDFVIQQLNLTAFTVAGTVLPNPDYRITLSDTRGGAWSDVSQHVGNLTGENRNSGARPYSLQAPKFLTGGAVISAILQNLTAVAALVDLAYVGFRITYRAPHTRMSILGES